MGLGKLYKKRAKCHDSGRTPRFGKLYGAQEMEEPTLLCLGCKITSFVNVLL